MTEVAGFYMITASVMKELKGMDRKISIRLLVMSNFHFSHF